MKIALQSLALSPQAYMFSPHLQEFPSVVPVSSHTATIYTVDSRQDYSKREHLISYVVLWFCLFKCRTQMYVIWKLYTMCGLNYFSLGKMIILVMVR